MKIQNFYAEISKTTFSPNQSITRGMVVTLLYRMKGQPTVNKDSSTFLDVSDKAYFANAVV